MMRRIRLAALLVVAGVSALAGQGAAPTAPQTPTFRVNVEYVEVDAVVTDGDGQFVRGLTKDDFQIFEDGKPQAISTFSIVDIPVERLQRPLYAAAPIEPDVKSNEQPFDGRIYVMVIDDLHTYFGRTPRVRSAARQFIQQNLGANDLMAVVHTAGPSDASQEFTSNKRLLLAAVDRTMGRKLDSATATKTEEYFLRRDLGRETDGPLTDPIEAERRTHAQQSLNALKNVADWFSNVRGRRKTILFVSEGIDYDITDFDNPGTSLSLIMDATRQTLAAAARGNVSIYGIDPRGLTNLADQTIEIGTFPDDTTLGLGAESIQKELFLSANSLRELSDETGGFAVINANDFSTAFDRIVRDNSSYYEMAYYPPSDKAGKFHKIEVRVRRPDLRVRARQGYVTPKSLAANETSIAKNLPNLVTPNMREALDSPLPISGLGMKVFAAPFKGKAPNASVLFGVELRGRDLRLNAGDKVAVTYAVVDTQGKVRAGSTDSLALTPRPEMKTRIVASGLRLLKREELPPGRYQVRFAAEDSGGNVGSVVYDLDVPDFAKLPFSMSGVALTSAAALAEPTVRPDEPLQQVMPGPPVAARRFPQNDEIALFVEVYDNDAGKPHKVDITTTVTSDDGKVMMKTEDARDSSELQGRRGGYGHAARLALKDLPPGSYVLTVSARSRLGGMPSAERQVQFTVTAPGAAPR
ncbi:MAG TPA: VWA domain-containing protein [Vicinamibacterales bacterium]